MMASSAENMGVNGAASPTQLFVINLAASTSPMALSHPSSPELKRFTFFVSRQREEGRERFRLHMGYFDTQEQAETLLASVRDVYPAAWAGPAPTTGLGRRGRIVPDSLAAVTPTGPAATPPPARAAIAAPPPVPAKAAAATPSVPVAKPVAAPAQPAMRSQVPSAQPAASKSPAPPRLDSMSNVRDVIAQLSETGPKAAPVNKVLSSADTLRLLEPQPARAAVPAPTPPLALPTLPALKNPFEGLEHEPEVRLVTPEDTQTLTDIRLDRQNNAPPCFAVQLHWSISPIDVAALPHLAIFDAYTLYNVEGNRQGRKWYGLRLGFFSDPNSATQVANYVRSDYKSVGIVPVAVKERDSARGGGVPQSAASELPRKTSDNDFKRETMDGFELLTDDRPAPAKRDLEDAGRGKPGAAAAARPAKPPVVPAPKPGMALAPQAAPGVARPATSGKPTGKRVVARRRPPAAAPDRTVSAGVGGAEVLESTLEILGASTLSLNNGGREVIHDSAGRKPAEKKAGRFSRLLSRLGGG